MDGTLYDIGDLIKHNFNQETIFLMDKLNVTKDEAEKMLTDNHIYPYVAKDAKSCTEYFLSLGLNIDEWNKIRSKDMPVDNINSENSVSIDTVNEYRKYAHTVLVSNNTRSNICAILNHLNISEDCFDMIIAKDSSGIYTPDKTDNFKKAADSFNVAYKDVLSIGDRYNTDLLPILNLGGKGLWVTGPKGVKEGLEIFDGKTEGGNYHLYR